MFDILINSAIAQDAAPQAPNSFINFVPMILIFLVVYFLMLRPQKKRMEEERKLLESVKKGDEIYTKSGILGKIISLNEKIVTLEVAEGVKIKILKGQIGGLSAAYLKDDKKKG